MKKADHQRIDAFELWCWRRLLRVPWTARRSNQSIIKEISPGYSLEGMMLKLKLQYFGHLMWRVDSLEKTLMLGAIGGRRRRGQQRKRWLDGITDSMKLMSLTPVEFDSTSLKLNEFWTELNWNYHKVSCPYCLKFMYLIKASYHVNDLLHTLIDPHDVIDIIGQYNLRNAQMDGCLSQAPYLFG